MTDKLLNAYGALCGQDEAITRIRAYAKAHGVRAAAREFGVSPGSVSGIMHGAAEITGKRITSWFKNSMTACPVLGVVSPHACRAHSAFARQRASRMVSNPDKLRLYTACRICKHANEGSDAN